MILDRNFYLKWLMINHKWYQSPNIYVHTVWRFSDDTRGHASHSNVTQNEYITKCMKIFPYDITLLESSHFSSDIQQGV